MRSAYVYDMLVNIKTNGSLVHGDIVEQDGRQFYKFTEFIFRGERYRVTLADQELKISTLTSNYWRPVAIAWKDSRKNYGFKKPGGARTSHNAIMQVVKFNLLMLGVGCLEEYIKNPTLEANHMRCSILDKASYNRCLAIYKAYKSKKQPKGIENAYPCICDGSIVTDAELRLTIAVTDNFKHKPSRMRDESVFNAELVTPEAHRRHTSLTQHNKLGINLKRYRLSADMSAGLAI